MTSPAVHDSAKSRLSRQAASHASQLVAAARQSGSLDARQLLDENPDLSQFKSLVIDLAYDEYCQARARGPVNAEDFAGRFPEIRASLLKLIGLHEMLERSPDVARMRVPPKWPEVGQEWLGFRLLEILGHGAFSRVFLAEQKALGDRLVVVKATSLGEVEAQVLGQLQHPNVVPVYSVEYDAERELSAVCLPFLCRTTLSDLLEEAFSQGKSPTADCIRQIVDSRHHADDPMSGPRAPGTSRVSYVDAIAQLLERVAEALAYTHRQKVLHLDIKPSNVLITPDGRALLFDFNLAKSELGSMLHLGGTIPYMAPEQLRVMANPAHPRHLDARTDLFSFGVMAYELLGGRLPFAVPPQNLSPEQLAERLLKRQPNGPPTLTALNPEVDRELATIVARCLAFSSKDRVQSADELLELLHARQSRARQWWRFAGRHRRTSICLAAGLALFCTTAIVYLQSRPSYATQELAAAKSAYGRSEFREAVIHLDRVLASQPSDSEAELLRCLALSKFDGRRALTAVVALSEKVSDPRVQALRTSLEVKILKDYRAAAILYANLIETESGTAAIHNNLAYCQLQVGQPVMAGSNIKLALQLEPDLPSAIQMALRVENLRCLGNDEIPDARIVDRARKRCNPSADLGLDLALASALRASRSPDPELRRAHRTQFLKDCKDAARNGCGKDALLSMAGFLPDLVGDPEFSSLSFQETAAPAELLVDPLLVSPERILLRR